MEGKLGSFLEEVDGNILRPFFLCRMRPGTQHRGDPGTSQSDLQTARPTALPDSPVLRSWGHHMPSVADRNIVTRRTTRNTIYWVLTLS